VLGESPNLSDAVYCLIGVIGGQDLLLF
jgi:hypothetical protein